MSKRTRLTKASGQHSWLQHYLHKIHQEGQKKLRELKQESMMIRVPIPKEVYPPFKSELKKLGAGDPYVVEEGTLSKVPGKDWLVKLLASEDEYSWCHRWDKSAGKSGGWKSRKLVQTDMMRETIDLRPDHSRALQYLLESSPRGMVLDAMEQIRKKKVELFEEIYKRKVHFVAEHDDAGQMHHDLWHSGIREVDPKDEKVTEISHGKKAEYKGESINPRVLTPFRSYGVSVGAASWARHMSAFREAGLTDDEIRKFAGDTLDALDGSIEGARRQNGENPRDLRLQDELDKFVGELFRQINAKEVDKALQEYVDDRRAGYSKGGVGLRLSNEARLAATVGEITARAERAEAGEKEEREGRLKVQETLRKVVESVGILFRTLGKSLVALVARDKIAKGEFEKLQSVVAGAEIPQTPRELLIGLQKSLTRSEEEPTMAEPGRKKRMDGPSLR